MSGAKRIYILIPTYNERENIELLINALESLQMNHHTIVIIDDNSPDGTGEIADRLVAERLNINVIHRPEKKGLGQAYIDGFRFALDRGADYVVTMDADLSHDPKYIPTMVSMMDDCDLVMGVRYDHGGEIKNWGWFRKILSAGANWLARRMLDLQINDLTTGFKCYSRQVLEKIGVENIFSEGYSFQVEMVYKAHGLGFRIGQVPIVFVNRTKGKSKISRGEAIKGFLTLLRLRREKITH